jgi:serine hydrolase
VVVRPQVLILPGFGGSGPGHWQTLWERQRGYARIEQDEWERPDRDAWVERLQVAIACGSEPAILVAHSLGCVLAAHWAARHGPGRVRGALLVAPPDVDEAQHLIPEIASFAPTPRSLLGFPAVVVMSRDDPYADPAVTAGLAAAWGARLVDVGACGHINTEAGFGEWPQGLALLDALLRN